MKWKRSEYSSHIVNQTQSTYPSLVNGPLLQKQWRLVNRRTRFTHFSQLQLLDVYDPVTVRENGRFCKPECVCGVSHTWSVLRRPTFAVFTLIPTFYRLSSYTTKNITFQVSEGRSPSRHRSTGLFHQTGEGRERDEGRDNRRKNPSVGGTHQSLPVVVYVWK